MGGPLEFWLQLPVRNDWRSVDLVRSSVRSCLAAMLADEDGLPDISMVAAELLENAVKYGQWSGEGSFRVHVSGGPDVACVAVENPIAGDDAHVAEVFKILDWIASFPTPEDAYRARILEIAEADPPTGGSGLGLVRIAYEAGARLTAEIVDGVLRVSATMPLLVTAQAA